MLNCLVANIFIYMLQRTKFVTVLLITLVLESKLSKQQIFEYYVNMIPLGRRGSFAICGVGEAAQAYF